MKKYTMMIVGLLILIFSPLAIDSNIGIGYIIRQGIFIDYPWLDSLLGFVQFISCMAHFMLIILAIIMVIQSLSPLLPRKND